LNRNPNLRELEVVGCMVRKMKIFKLKRNPNLRELEVVGCMVRINTTFD
jgi:uncharacterized membrane protein